jgi:hypothetical protein
MSERLSFVFYLTWKTQIDEMNDEELRRFINNLIIWHSGGEVLLPTREDRFIWNGILPALEVNEKKYIARAGSSRENGKLGGRPPKDNKTQITQQVLEEPNKPVKGKRLIEESLKKNVESKMFIENDKENIDDESQNKKENKSTITLKEYRNIFNELFIGYPTWEQDLLRYGVNQFLIMNKRFHVNTNDFKEMFEEFLTL